MNRVGDGTGPLAIVIYVDGSFIKNKIAKTLSDIGAQECPNFPNWFAIVRLVWRW